MAATNKTEILDPIFSIQVRAYTSRKSWHLQFHNSEHYFRTRPLNLCSHRRCERDFVHIPTHFYHATTLQLHAFAWHSASWPAGPMTIRILILAFLYFFNHGDLYYLGHRCDELPRATERLASIGAQDALTLLRASFSSPKVLHLLRCSPYDTIRYEMLF